MKHSLGSFVAAVAVATAVLAGTASEATAEHVILPPAAYVASYEPFYVNGMAHYWYRDRWFYRDHGVWKWYGPGLEPAFLREHYGEWAHHWHHWR